MTISYANRFSSLLLRWKGSLWKTICKDLVIYMIMYYVINFIYRFALSEQHQQGFMKVSLLFSDYTEQIPLTFLLGFYVGMVVKRWWEQFTFISWPDTFLLYVSAMIRGQRPEDRSIRRTIARYTILVAVLAWRSLSTSVMKRFPTDQHLIDGHLITVEELKMMNSVKLKHDPHKGWFVPAQWIQNIIVRCYELKRFSHVNELKWLLSELAQYRNNFIMLFKYDWISIPLVYTQVATIATYGYFGLCLIARQYPTETPVHILPANITAAPDNFKTVDVYIPLFTILQFLFYVGWLKVGEDLMSPFGEDDEDFELNYIIDRHFEMAYIIVDRLHDEIPPLYPSAEDLVPNVRRKHIPHTNASRLIPEHKPKSHVGLASKLSPYEIQFVPLDHNSTDDAYSDADDMTDIKIDNNHVINSRLARHSSSQRSRTHTNRSSGIVQEEQVLSHLQELNEPTEIQVPDSVSRSNSAVSRKDSIQIKSQTKKFTRGNTVSEPLD